MGEWEILGDPCIMDVGRNTFHSQISCIFKHPKKKNLYIAMADRWLTDLPKDLPNIGEILESFYDQTKKCIPFDEKKYTKRNTSIAEYVWLPIQFENDKPTIRWYGKWKWEDF
jgi:hypothetical protein